MGLFTLLGHEIRTLSGSPSPWARSVLLFILCSELVSAILLIMFDILRNHSEANILMHVKCDGERIHPSYVIM